MSASHTIMARAALPEILNTSDLSMALRRSPRTIRRLIAEGIIPAIRIGRGYFTRRSDLMDALSPSGPQWPPDGVDVTGSPYFGGSD